MKFFIWSVFVIIFIGNQIFEHFGGQIHFLSSYLDDFLFFPITLPFAVKIYSKIKSSSIKLSDYELFIIFLFFSLLFEFIFPIINSGYTSDLWDFVPYFIGLVFYRFFLTNNNIA